MIITQFYLSYIWRNKKDIDENSKLPILTTIKFKTGYIFLEKSTEEAVFHRNYVEIVEIKVKTGRPLWGTNRLTDFWKLEIHLNWLYLKYNPNSVLNLLTVLMYRKLSDSVKLLIENVVQGSFSTYEILLPIGYVRCRNMRLCIWIVHQLGRHFILKLTFLENN